MNVGNGIGCALLLCLIGTGLLAAVSNASYDLNLVPWQITYVIGTMLGCLTTILGGISK